ncbi:MAG: arginine repressor [Gammaproteobacteria bacterium]|nr:arginine repressor [Gammaproteobacteria bacterium]
MQTGAHHAARRHECIAELIRGQSVGSQAELGELLAQRGIRVSQSCLSRDLSLLGAVKRGRSYTLVRPDLAEDDRQALSAYARSVEQAGPHLAIVRTATGAAQRIALFLDRSGWREILATLAGDDTIFVATRNQAEQRALLSRLRREMG